MTQFNAKIFFKLSSADLAARLWNEGLCQEFELARSEFEESVCLGREREEPFCPDCVGEKRVEKRNHRRGEPSLPFCFHAVRGRTVGPVN